MYWNFEKILLEQKWEKKFLDKTHYYLELVKNKLQSIVNSFISITSFYTIAIIVEAPWDIFSHSFMFVGIYYLLRALNNKKFNFKNIFLKNLLFL